VGRLVSCPGYTEHMIKIIQNVVCPSFRQRVRGQECPVHRCPATNLRHAVRRQPSIYACPSIEDRRVTGLVTAATVVQQGATRASRRNKKVPAVAEAGAAAGVMKRHASVCYASVENIYSY